MGLIPKPSHYLPDGTPVYALESLAAAGSDFILEVSHMGYLTALLDAAGIPETARRSVLEHLRHKNAHELRGAALAAGASAPQAEKLTALARDALAVARKKSDEREVKYGNICEAIRSYQEAVFYLDHICLGGGVIDEIYTDGRALSDAIAGVTHAQL